MCREDYWEVSLASDGDKKGAISSKRGGNVEPIRMIARVGRDLVEDGGCPHPRLPAPNAAGFGRIQHDPGNIEGAGGWVGSDDVWPKFFGAPFAQLAEGGG